MSRPFILCAVACWSIGVLAIPACYGQQTFQNAFGNINSDNGYSISATNDGGYIVTGDYDVDGPFSAQVYLVKVDSLGDLGWTKTYGGAKELRNGTGNRGYGVLQTVDGGYIIGGEVHAFGAGRADMYLIKTNASGDIAWSRSIGGVFDDYCYAIQQTSDSGFILAGSTESFGAGLRNIYVVRASPVGDTLWTRVFAGSSFQGAYDVKETLDGGFIITGYTFDTPTQITADIFLIKTNATGEIGWQKSYGGTLHEYGYSVSQTTDGGFIVAGSTASYGAGSNDIALLRTDSLGNLMWASTYGGSDAEEGNSVIQLQDLGFLVVGYTRSFGAGGFDTYVIRTDSLGVLQWSRIYGGPNDDVGQQASVTGDGGYMITGGTSSYGEGSSDLYIIGIDSMGESGCHQQGVTTSASSAPVSVGLLALQAGHGGVVADPPTITGNTTSVQSDLCAGSSAITKAHHPGVDIYPSLVSTCLHLEQSSDLAFDIKIYNALGQLVYASSIRPHSTELIDMSQYSEGLYYVSALAPGIAETTKILVVR